MNFWQEIITLTRPICRGAWNLPHKFHLYLILFDKSFLFLPTVNSYLKACFPANICLTNFMAFSWTLYNISNFKSHSQVLTICFPQSFSIKDFPALHSSVFSSVLFIDQRLGAAHSKRWLKYAFLTIKWLQRGNYII